MTEQLVNYNITDAAIREMREQYMRLRIVDLDDKDGAKAVSAARRAVKAKRCEVERLRKELKADALEWGRKVDSEAKRITEQLAPIEKHLEDEEARIEQERARIAAEEEARAEAERRSEQERVLGRMTALAKFGGPASEMRFEEIARLSEMEFDDLLEGARARWEKAEAERKAEEQRLEQIRLEQAAERERIAEERRVLEEEKRKLAEEKAAKLPSVIEMINEFRDHEPEFLQDPPEPQSLQDTCKPEPSPEAEKIGERIYLKAVEVSSWVTNDLRLGGYVAGLQKAAEIACECHDVARAVMEIQNEIKRAVSPK